MPILPGRASDGAYSSVIGVTPNTGTTGVAPVGANRGPASTGLAVIDGTPVRVVVLALSAALGLTALRMAGFRFNVGVSAGG
jgi:hypothetical protein